ncbi:D-alanine--D-alanine ligase family protein [Rhizobium sp. CNPSo 4039]|uniref:D-alanine--D-alanine ligase family protein n=1 Tax=Rhizobium sp. CNPSo 4039 TaxID=3021409 RepID=UPI00254A9A90|nr:D-alanine--D-alanine ligase family protein [Rhizobium sp. CNPSo 4039]MDK4711086.1 D-alanine--D-alanine ligase [Rhizobium sp. CNPSo 4039]
MSKLRVAVLFGGQSSEHEVSVMSARNVVKAIDGGRYEIVPILIDRGGRWLLVEEKGGALPEPIAYEGRQVCLIPGGKGRLLALEGTSARELPAVDVLFPVLHGLNGEDGSIQGLAQIVGLPLVGCGILGSANAIDKDMAKRLLREAGLPVARSLTLTRGEKPDFDEIAATLGSPVFVKPTRQGSSVGVSKAQHAAAFGTALAEAFRHDRKVLVEEFVRAREIEYAVLEQPDGTLFVSVPGEIATSATYELYSYEAKYLDQNGAVVTVPADIPADTADMLKRMAADGFRALGCEGLARVDFFLRPDGSAVINEINTMPGFTNISMYPKAMGASGISYPELISRLIEHGLARARQG